MSDFRPKRAESRPERADSGPEKADSRPEKADSRPERADFRPEGVDFRSERADFRPERACGGTDRQTDRERNEQKSPVFYRTLSLLGLLPKKYTEPVAQNLKSGNLI